MINKQVIFRLLAQRNVISSLLCRNHGSTSSTTHKESLGEDAKPVNDENTTHFGFENVKKSEKEQKGN